MNAIENEQQFLFDCPLYTGIRQQHTALFGPDQGSTRLLLAQCGPNTFGRPLHSPVLGCPMSHIWLPKPDYKFH